MEKQIFKIGDRVFDIRFGWGKVIDDDKGGLFPIGVQFDNNDSQEVIVYTDDGKHMPGEEFSLLSFTEYTLQGFSQERPINYNDYIGKWGKFWNDDFEDFEDYYVISKLKEYKSGDTYKFKILGGIYNTFEPLTEEQIKVLNLE